MNELICGKCGHVIADKDVRSAVSPIDRNGNNLKRVLLCDECSDNWSRAYASKVLPKYRGKIRGDEIFRRGWAMIWENFIRGKYDHEEVQFT